MQWLPIAWNVLSESFPSDSIPRPPRQPKRFPRLSKTLTRPRKRCQRLDHILHRCPNESKGSPPPRAAGGVWRPALPATSIPLGFGHRSQTSAIFLRIGVSCTPGLKQGIGFTPRGAQRRAAGRGATHRKMARIPRLCIRARSDAGWGASHRCRPNFGRNRLNSAKPRPASAEVGMTRSCPRLAKFGPSGEAGRR